MEITIPERIVEAIEQGEELSIHKFAGRCFVKLSIGNSFVMESHKDLLFALMALNRVLPLTMKETAMHGASKGGAA